MLAVNSTLFVLSGLLHTFFAHLKSKICEVYKKCIFTNEKSAAIVMDSSGQTHDTIKSENGHPNLINSESNPRLFDGPNQLRRKHLTQVLFAILILLLTLEVCSNGRLKRYLL